MRNIHDCGEKEVQQMKDDVKKQNFKKATRIHAKFAEKCISLVLQGATTWRKRMELKGMQTSSVAPDAFVLSGNRSSLHDTAWNNTVMKGRLYRL